ncbi:MAG TPA: alpha/beta hydrolase fold domain-containing protein [Trebonia sp.]|jgi:acetyl esterase/lipase|nr:alpha/beta hydrolase fold domain-containing protein [Trebonia sp.]
MSETKPVLEPAAQQFADSTASPPYLFDLPIADGRKLVDSVQDGDIPAPAVDTEEVTVPGGPAGPVSVTVFRPAGVAGPLPVVVYTHGAGWVFGDAHTHDRLVRELTVRANVATVFTNYSLSPEARYPTDPAARAEITASPLRATLDDLAGLPAALVIVGEADVLRDEGEAYAAKLRAAGAPVTAVRFQGIIHDFVMVNAMRDTHAARTATAMGGDFLRDALHGKE